MLIKPSKQLEARIGKVQNSKYTGTFKPEAVIHNPDTGYKFNVRAVRSLVIVQNFLTEYMDRISMVIDVRPDEYTKLRTNLNNLRCTLFLYPVDDAQNILYDCEPAIYNTRVLIPQLEDVEKAVNANFVEDENNLDDEDNPQNTQQFRQELYAPLEIQLVEPSAYELRHIQLNAIFTQTQLEPVLYWAGKNFGATSFKIITPDNSTTYDNLPIPPMKDISNLVPFLQERYGIYAKGAGYYFTADTFYVYPLYSTDVKSATIRSVLHAVATPEGMYTSPVNYNIIDDDLWVIAGKSELKTTNTKASENSGTTAISIQADRQRDQEVNIQKNGKIEFNTNDKTIIQMQNKGGLVSGNMQHIKYVNSSTNIYLSTSQMAANDGTYLTFGWRNATLKRIEPGMHIVYHYDGKGGKYKIQEGTVLGVTYTSEQVEGTITSPSFRFTAIVVAKLSSDYSSEEEYQYR